MFDFKCFSKEFMGMRTGEMKIPTEDSQSALTETQGSSHLGPGKEKRALPCQHLRMLTVLLIFQDLL